jgi:hypothetical protein
MGDELGVSDIYREKWELQCSKPNRPSPYKDSVWWTRTYCAKYSKWTSKLDWSTITERGYILEERIEFTEPHYENLILLNGLPRFFIIYLLHFYSLLKILKEIN